MSISTQLIFCKISTVCLFVMQFCTAVQRRSCCLIMRRWTKILKTRLKCKRTHSSDIGSGTKPSVDERKKQKWGLTLKRIYDKDQIKNWLEEAAWDKNEKWCWQKHQNVINHKWLEIRSLGWISASKKTIWDWWWIHCTRYFTFDVNTRWRV